MGKYLYNPIMNRWINSYDSKEYSSAVFKEGYDDPTYMTFKIEFGDWGASVLDRSQIQLGTTAFKAAKNDYDALPIGLLNCPYPGIKDGIKYWQNDVNTDSAVFNETDSYSAFRYLRSRNEDTRAKYLYYFVNGLFEIQHDTPYLFKKISGLGALEKFDPKTGQRLAADTKITVECIEGLSLKMRTLMELYRKAAWDDVYQKWILPENMRQFKMIIYVFERRVFHDVGTFSNEDSNILRKGTHSIMKYSKSLNGDIPVKAYECCPCEFDIAGSMSWNDSYSSATENAEEITKLVINVKNVKTYYLNGLLNKQLGSYYDNHEKQSINEKISDLMIYDLVEGIERSNSDYQSANDIAQAEDTFSRFNNMTVNGVRAMFLNKNILLENEDAKDTLLGYVWGSAIGGPFSYAQYMEDNNIIRELQGAAGDSLYSRGMNYNYRPTGTVSAAIQDPIMEINNLYDDYPRAGWVNVLVNQPTYDHSQSFWHNLCNAAYEVMHGARRQVLISGCAGFNMMMDSWNCIINSLYYDGYVSTAIDLPGDILSLSKGRIRKSTLMQPEIKDISVNHGQFEELDPVRTPEDQPYQPMEEPRIIPGQNMQELDDLRIVPDQNMQELDDPRLVPAQTMLKPDEPRPVPEYDMQKMNDPRDVPYQQMEEMDPLRDVPGQLMKEMDPLREIPDYEMAEMDPLREMPDYEMAEMDPLREMPDYEMAEMDPLRKMPKQKMEEIDPLREIPDYEMSEMDPLRKMPKQKMEEMDPLRELPEHEMHVMEHIRKVPNQKMSEMEPLRDITGHQYNKMEKPRKVTKGKMTDLIADVRTLPGFEKITLDELRDVPEQDLQKLIDTVNMTKPEYKINGMEVIDTISKATENKKTKISNLDKENKEIEKAIFDTLKLQMDTYKMLEIADDDSESVKKKKSIANFAKLFSDNSEKIKDALADNIINMKYNLINLSKDAVRDLPRMNMYILKKGETPNKEEQHINDLSLASENDIHQLNHNIKIMQLSDAEIKDLSFSTLINLNKEMEDRLSKTTEMKGLSQIIKNSDDEDDNKKMQKMSKHTAKHKNREMLGLLPPREVNRNQIIY